MPNWLSLENDLRRNRSRWCVIRKYPHLNAFGLDGDARPSSHHKAVLLNLHAAPVALVLSSLHSSFLAVIAADFSSYGALPVHKHGRSLEGL